LCVPITEAAQAAGCRHALLIADETAIRPSTRSAPAIDRTPRIVLRTGWSGKRHRSGNKGKRRKREFRARSSFLKTPHVPHFFGKTRNGYLDLNQIAR